MNMYLHELRSLRKSTIIWTCGIIALMLIYFSLYPNLLQDAADFEKLLNGYPETIKSALGITTFDITSLIGYYAIVFAFIPLCGAIQAMILGTSMLSKETRERTADFLLTKPVSRTSIVSAKLMASITTLLVTDVIFFAATFIVANMVKTNDYDVNIFFLINLTLLYVQLIFFAIGLVVSVFFRQIKSVLPISLGVVFGTYLIGALIATTRDDPARYLSPFKYFDFAYIVKNSSYELSYVITAIAIVIVSVVATYVIYRKKDIHAVS